jgi:aryl-alcohol dehydrogenase-like predicted oxidoreductase
LQDLAEKKHAKPAQIALAWLLHKPNVAAPIVGATKMEHLVQKTNISSFNKFRLTHADLFTLN